MSKAKLKDGIEGGGMTRLEMLKDIETNREMVEMLQTRTGDTYINCLRALLKQSGHILFALEFLKYYSFDREGNMVVLKKGY